MHQEWAEIDRPLVEVVASTRVSNICRGFLSTLSCILLVFGSAPPSHAEQLPQSNSTTHPSPLSLSEVDGETVSESLRLTSVSPAAVSRALPTQISILGQGLSRVTTMALDGEVIEAWSALDDSRIDAVLPRTSTLVNSAVLELATSSGSVTWVMEVIESADLVEAVDTPRGFIVKYRDRRAALGALAATSNELDLPEASLQAGRPIGPQTMTVQPEVPLTSQESALVLEELRADSGIEWAEPNYRIQPLTYPETPPNDTKWSSQQWSLWDTYGIGVADGTSTMGTGWQESQGAGVVVAVLDTGYTPHEDMPSYPSGQWVAGYDFVSSFTSPEIVRFPTPSAGSPTMVDVDGDYVNQSIFGALGWDDNPLDPGDWNARSSIWHGTLISGQIAALTNNALGVAAAAPRAKVQPIRVLSWDGGDVGDLVAAIRWASGESISGVPPNSNPANVINLSLGSTALASCPLALGEAIESAKARGSIVVAAAGNSNAPASNYFPANCTGVMTVGSTGVDGKRAPTSNYGSVVDLSAPGESIWGLYNPGTTTPTSATNTYQSLSGTSFAAPLVAATAAMLKSWNQTLTPAQIEGLLVNNVKTFAGGFCDSDVNRTCGSGIVNVSAALAAAAPGTAGTSLRIGGSNNQNARVGTTLSDSLTVTVLSSSSSPLRNVTVTYGVVSGGGSVAGSSVVTDSNGTATLGVWTLGPVAGTNTLRATISGTSTSVLFTATGEPAPPGPTPPGPSPAPPGPSPSDPGGGGSTADPGGSSGSGGETAPTPGGSLEPTGILTSIGVGQVIAETAGARVPVKSSPIMSRLALELTGAGFGVVVRATQFGGGSAELTAAGAVRIQPGQALEISGYGYAPGSSLQVYAGKPVRALGAITVAADGTFQGRFAVPTDLIVGAGGVQVNGVAVSAAVRSVSIGVEIRDSALTSGKKLRTTVYFPAGSTVLPPAQQAKLRRLLEQVPRNSEVSVLARGYAPKRVPGGDSPAARSRADSVVDYLRSIELVGEAYASGTGRSKLAGNEVRRVEVTLTYLQIPKVQAISADRN